MSFPKKEERTKCWAARDDFWQCMDSTGDKVDQCSRQRKAFEENCTKTWVTYFDRRRNYLQYKEKIEKEGFEPIGSSSKSQGS